MLEGDFPLLSSIFPCFVNPFSQRCPWKLTPSKDLSCNDCCIQANARLNICNNYVIYVILHIFSLALT